MFFKKQKALAAAFLAIGGYALLTSPLLEAAVSRIKTFSSGEVLTAADLNAEFNNILNNGEDLAWPATKAKDLNSFELILDADGDTSITADTDDRIDFRASGFDALQIDGTTASIVNGLSLTATATTVAPTIAPRGEADIGLGLLDSNGNEILTLGATASAVNEVTITNAATGAGPVVDATGGDTNIPVTLKGKGTGPVILGQATSTDVRLAADQPIADSSGNELVKFVKTASAVNEITVTNAATGGASSIATTGGDTDIGLDVQTKGAGIIQLLDGSGNEVLKTAPAVASAINELTVSNSAAGDAVTLSATGGDTDIGLNFVPKGAGTLEKSGIPFLAVAQVVNTQTGAVGSGTTVIPNDDTIPQNDEGVEFVTLAITPKNATSTLIIEVHINLSHSAGGGAFAIVGLFQDTTANALAVMASEFPDATSPISLSFRHSMSAGTTSATTFKVRAGSSSAGTTTFNGVSGARKWGGALASSITITEILPN
jgi:hypothetical protein